MFFFEKKNRKTFVPFGGSADSRALASRRFFASFFAKKEGLPAPRVAVAVSGGADSICLAWLLKPWAEPFGLIVDHGLRAGSAEDARAAAAILAGFGVASRILTLEGLARGPGVAARARAARYHALETAAAERGLTDLFLGHHLRDQAETVLLREACGSGPAGLAGMPAVAERGSVRLLRPLLGVPPGALRATLREAGIPWIEDPSNHDPAFTRVRLRAALDDAAGDGPRVRALAERAAAAGLARQAADRRIAADLAAQVSLHPEGYALLAPGARLCPAAFGALIGVVAGRTYPAETRALARLAACPAPATLAGARLLPAGRLGRGLLLVREAAAMAPPIPARVGALWDGRFRLRGVAIPPGTTLGALGGDAARFRGLSHLPAAVLQSLPALRLGDAICAIPHLSYAMGWTNHPVGLTFEPATPAAGAAWSGAAWSGAAWSGAAWSGAAWSGAAWSGAAWSGDA